METIANAATPSLKLHQIELAERILQFGFFLNVALDDLSSNVSGDRALGFESKGDLLIYRMAPDELDLQRYRIGRFLPFVYEYAYEGRKVMGATDWNDWYGEAGDRDVLGAFVEMTDVDGVAAILAEYDFTQTNYLRQMLSRADARNALDSGEALSINQLALLANLNERSVRNALKAEGVQALTSSDGETVPAREALRWLESRRGMFKKTSIVVFGEDELPEALSLAEIPVFIGTRIAQLFAAQESDPEDCCYPIEKAAHVLGWNASRIYDLTQDTSKIDPKDCAKLANILRVDPAWFTEQVMCALFPEQMSLIEYRKEFELPAAESYSGVIEVPLTENGIKHGYLDIPATLSDFFPADSFGGRGADDRGVDVELRYAGLSKKTDMRVKSSITISPRIRFTSYFNLHRAKPGDLIKIGRIDERTFELTHQSQA